MPSVRRRHVKKATMLKQFREFAVRGNVVDLAVGVIIGAAFGNIVSSLVADIFMPLIGARSPAGSISRTTSSRCPRQ